MHFYCFEQSSKVYLLITIHCTLGLGRYGQQPIRYVFDTDNADTIRIRYGKNVHDLRFHYQELNFNNKVNVFGLIYTMNPTNTSAKVITCVVYYYIH